MGYPTADQVQVGVVFGATNELTGTLAVPPAANVQLGVNVAQTQGTLRVPGNNQVKNGVSFGAADALTGTLTIPSVNRVVAGWAYGAGGTEFVGEYDANLPTASQVLFGVTFGPSPGTSGNVRLPAPEQVELNVNYGPQAATTGLFTGEGGSIPSVQDIADHLLDRQLGSTRYPPGTVGEALQAARADVFGDRAQVGATLRYYGPDKTTVLKTMNVNDPTNPTTVTDADGDAAP